jgi:hypothetical protein
MGKGEKKNEAAFENRATTRQDWLKLHFMSERRPRQAYKNPTASGLSQIEGGRAFPKPWLRAVSRDGKTARETLIGWAFEYVEDLHLG